MIYIAGLQDAHNVGKRLTRYFKQDNAKEIAARDELIKCYVKLHLNETAPIPLDDKDGLEAAVGEMTLDKVPPKLWNECGSARELDDSVRANDFISVKM